MLSHPHTHTSTTILYRSEFTRSHTHTIPGTRHTESESQPSIHPVVPVHQYSQPTKQIIILCGPNCTESGGGGALTHTDIAVNHRFPEFSSRHPEENQELLRMCLCGRVWIWTRRVDDDGHDHDDAQAVETTILLQASESRAITTEYYLFCLK